MAATCDCGWTGGPMQVRDGGRCRSLLLGALWDMGPNERRDIIAYKGLS